LDEVAVDVVAADGIVAAAGALGVAEPVIELGGVAGMLIVNGSEALACVAMLVADEAGAV
jgi:hypothetical protein